MHEEHWKGRSGLLSLWAGVMLPPLAFLLNLQVAYMLVPRACSGRWELGLHLVALLFLLMAGAGGWMAWRDWQRTGKELPGDEGGAIPRSRFLATLGLLSSGLFVLTILAQWLAMFILGPCHIA